MSSPASRWRAPIIGAVTGLLVAAAVIGPSALASGGATTPESGTTANTATTTSTPATTTAPTIDCNAPPPGAQAKRPGGPSAGPGPAPFLAAVAQLVRAGTIDDAQARILDAGIRGGSIDPSQLVANGTLSSAQAQAVMEHLGAGKRSLAPAAQPGADAKAMQRKRSQH
ncbi:MAG: hypothetical protein ACXVEW_01085 [Solirubrobacteraceae bacterium]